MRAIDTNVLVRLIVGDDRRQTAAEEFTQRGVWASHLVVAETIWALALLYEMKPAQLADAVEMLLNHQDLTIQDADVVGQAVAQFREHPALGFSDCLVLEIARKAGHLPLGTLGRELSKLEGAERLVGAAARGT